MTEPGFGQARQVEGYRHTEFGGIPCSGRAQNVQSVDIRNCHRDQFFSRSHRASGKNSRSLIIYYCDMKPEGRNSGARRRSLLANGSGKHVTATIEVLFETMFSISSVRSGYKRRELRFGAAECS
jgi:hypothetical protein